MGRKQNQNASEDAQLQVVQNRDLLQRLNFLYQASQYLAQCSSSSTGTTERLNSSVDLVHNPSIGQDDALAQARASHTTAYTGAATIGGAITTTKNPAGRNKKPRNANRHHSAPLSLLDLSRSYIDSMRSVGSRTVTRIDPMVKRTLCKGCNALLLPGTQACRTRILASSSHAHKLRVTCTQCGASRVIPCPPREAEFTPEAKDAVAANADNAMESIEGVPVQAEEPKSAQTRAKRREKRAKKRATKIPFFERPEHVVFRGRTRLYQASDAEQLPVDTDNDPMHS